MEIRAGTGIGYIWLWPEAAACVIQHAGKRACLPPVLPARPIVQYPLRALELRDSVM